MEEVDTENVIEVANTEGEDEQLDTINEFASQVNNFKEKQPDFPDAFSYLVECRDKQLQQYSHIDSKLKDNATRINIIEQEAIAILEQASKAGIDAADFLYNLARSQGYKGNSDKIYRNIEAQKAAKTLTATSGGVATSALTMEGLAAMSQEDFDRWYWKNKDEFNRIMGR